ncbi:MAG: hypothetical protein HY690_04715 [Chloroflexi bacterium]|nr:hypothetical protein [Chloroflexota bacterium]
MYAPQHAELAPLDLLANALNLHAVPFTERGSRLLVMRAPVGEGLTIFLAEEWLADQPGLGSHRSRPFLGHLRPLDQDGHPLDFEVDTWPHQLRLRTARGDFLLCFVDEQCLAVGLPAGAGLGFEVQAASVAQREGVVRWEGLRRLALQAGPQLRVESTAQDGTHRVELCNAALGPATVPLAMGEAPMLPERGLLIEAVQEAAARRWAQWFAAAPPPPVRYRRPYYYAWYLLRANVLSARGSLTRDGIAPSKFRYLGVWHWDALFHALGCRHADLALALDQVRLLLEHQQPDGMIPDVVRDVGVIVRAADGQPITKPPLLGWATLRLFEAGAGRGFLAEVYGPLVRWHRWWATTAEGDSLPRYLHAYSSGLDDSPLWDAGLPAESPDLGAYLCVQAQSLATIARLLGRGAEADDWAQEAEGLFAQLLARLYDPATGLFWPRRGDTLVRVLTPFNLLPLWTGRLAEGQAAPLLAALADPARLWRPFPVATVSADEPTYDAQQMWRGPVWINANYLLVEALLAARQPALARRLADRTLELVASQPEIAEYYDPETGAVPPSAAAGFSWSAALFIDLVLRRARGDLATATPPGAGVAPTAPGGRRDSPVP